VAVKSCGLPTTSQVVEEQVVLFPVRVGGKNGYIDKTGKILIKPQFDYAWPFFEGLAVVKIGDRLGYIDKTGEFIWEPAE